jgi:CheY-like chemotaxis protein
MTEHGMAKSIKNGLPTVHSGHAAVELDELLTDIVSGMEDILDDTANDDPRKADINRIMNKSKKAARLGDTLLQIRQRGQNPGRRGQKNDAVARSKVILLVEDDTSVRKFAKVALQKSGYKVCAGSDVDEADGLVKKSTDKFDLLITDIVLPKGNGKTFANRMQTKDPKLKVLFVSGYPADFQVSDFPGKVSFLLKPFGAKELVSKVERMFKAS